jgi:hypothetical protein
MNNTTEKKLPRLFRAYTHTDMLSRYYDNDMQIDWFCKERETPVAPYDELIEGYEGLRPKARAHAEHFVNELLIEEEVKGLTGFFMRAQGETLRATEVALPVCCEEMTLYERKEVLVYHPADPDYDLGLPVVGFCSGVNFAKLREEERLAEEESLAECAEEKEAEFILEKDSTIAAL